MERKINIKKINIYFHGNFIPLQGIDCIIKAAKILETEKYIEFYIIGKGQTYDMVVELIKQLNVINIKLLGRLSYNDLPKELSKADICLGIFGNTEKTNRVIPNKIYESIALGKPVITADTMAIRELFEDKKNILLCKISDEKDLADKILELANNQELSQKIADGGREIFEKYCTPKAITEDLLKEIKPLLQ